MKATRQSGPGHNYPYPRERVFAPVKVVLAEAFPIRALLTFAPCYPWQAKLATRVLDVEGEVLLGALAPELADAAVRRPPIVVVQAERRRVDDGSVADRQEDREAEQPPGERRGDERVLVLRVNDLGALAPGDAGDGEPGPRVEERVREPLRGRERSSRRQPHGKRKPHDRHALALLAPRRAVVRRHDGDAVAAAGHGAGEGLQAPLGASRRERREILVDEADVHGAPRAATRPFRHVWRTSS